MYLNHNLFPLNLGEFSYGENSRDSQRGVMEYKFLGNLDRFVTNCFVDT